MYIINIINIMSIKNTRYKHSLKKNIRNSRKNSRKRVSKNSRKNSRKNSKRRRKSISKNMGDGCVYKYKDKDENPMFFKFEKINDSNYSFWFNFATENLKKDDNNQGIQGFHGSLNLYNLSEFKNVIYVAFISSTETITIDSIEMCVIVFIEKNVPFSTHMGIFRNLLYSGFKHKNISLILHSYAACETLKINKDVLYMVTKPIAIMSKILLDKFIELKLYDKIWFGDKLQRDFILSEKNQIKYNKVVQVYSSLLRLLKSSDKISLDILKTSLFNTQIGTFIKKQIITVVDILNTNLKAENKDDIINSYVRSVIDEYIRYLFKYYYLSMNTDRVNGTNGDIINIEIYPDLTNKIPIDIIYKNGKEVWIINDREFIVPSWFIKNPLIFTKTEDLNKVETLRMCIIDEHTLSSLYFD